MVAPVNRNSCAVHGHQINLSSLKWKKEWRPPFLAVTLFSLERMWRGAMGQRHEVCFFLKISTRRLGPMSCMIIIKEETLYHRASLSSGKSTLTWDLGPCLLPGFVLRNHSANLGLHFDPFHYSQKVQLRNWTRTFLPSNTIRDKGVEHHISKPVFSEWMSPGVLDT